MPLGVGNDDAVDSAQSSESVHEETADAQDDEADSEATTDNSDDEAAPGFGELIEGTFLLSGAEEEQYYSTDEELGFRMSGGCQDGAFGFGTNVEDAAATTCHRPSATRADVVVRLPRRPMAAAGVLHEIEVLQHIERASIGSIVRTPRMRHVGQPHEAFPHHWSVLEWIDGDDAWTLRDELDGRALGPLGPVLERLQAWLDSPHWDAADFFDVTAVRRLASEAHDVVDEPVDEGFVHGDLIPGNLLLDRDQLSAIIDWGGAGRGDLAQDSET